MDTGVDFDKLRLGVRNWSRWGDEDELGTWNLVTAEKAREAASGIRRGASFSLALPLGQKGPAAFGRPYGRINPVRTMTAVNQPLTSSERVCAYSDDIVTMGIQCGTHWDALPHVSYHGTLYNGYPDTTIGPAGAARCPIDRRPAVVGRGVLLDVAQAHGVHRLDPHVVVTSDDLELARQRAGLQLSPGDIVLVRTGQITRLTEDDDAAAYARPAPGLAVETAAWMHRHDIGALAVDNLAVERPYEGDEADVGLPLHVLALVDMGMPLGENFDLEALAADCAEDGVYEFWLDASPLPFVGSTGGIVNPVAVK